MTSKKNTKSKKVSNKKEIKLKKRNTKVANSIAKLIIIIFIVAMIFGITNYSKGFENHISLLAVSENSNGDVISGSKIDLNLEIKPGNGNIYTSLNTIEDIDTQISIINSQKVACNLFKLDCKNYDFFYSFNGSAILLKGPSASTAIAILTAKTMNKEKIDQKTVITGSLSSGGLIGNVGGINKKIEVAYDFGYDKVIIPLFSDYNETIIPNITVIKAIDIIEAYNNFDGNKFALEKQNLNLSQYNVMMKELGDLMCDRSQELKEQINYNLIQTNSTQEIYLTQAKKSFNSSIIAKNNENYYSQGSFCYNSNLNYRSIIEIQKNLTIEERKEENKKLKDEINLKYVIINSDDYKSKIETINDFYSYMIIIDRVTEAQELIKEEKEEVEKILNISFEDQNKNYTKIGPKLDDYNKQLEQKYSTAKERLYTVELWEKFIVNYGEKISFDENNLNRGCLKISKDINVKNQLLANYGFKLFEKDVNEINLLNNNEQANKYLCLYKGFELNGRMNTVLNSIGINNGDEKEYIEQIVDLTESRLGINSNGNFPLIPYIYFEYSKELFDNNNTASALLYSNYALAYSDLELYVEKEEKKNFNFNNIIENLYTYELIGFLFIFALLLILAFGE